MRRIIVWSLLLIAPTLVAQDLYVPASAHADGVGQTQWRTDLEVKARSAETASFTLQLLRAGHDNSEPMDASFTVDPGQSLRLEDVIAEVFGFNGSAALRVIPTSGTILVTSRTYNNDSDGTYGQFIPAFEAREAAQQGSDYALIQLSRSASPTTRYRTNLGFVNATGIGITVEVDLYTAAGVMLGSTQLDLLPYEMQQLNDVFADVTVADVAEGYAVVRSRTGGASFFAYASVVDNRSGDAIFIPSQLESATAEEARPRFVVFEAFMRDG